MNKNADTTSLAWASSGETGVLSRGSGADLRYLEDPNEPEKEAVEKLGPRLADLRILVIPPCSIRTIDEILRRASNLRRLIVADDTPSRLEAWAGTRLKLPEKLDVVRLPAEDTARASSELESHLLKYWDEFLLAKTSVYVPARFRRAAPALSKLLEGVTLRLQQSVSSDAALRQLRGWRIHVNTILNMSALPRSFVIERPTELETVVVVGAGPSLDDTAPELARLQDKALIVATDGSLNTLFKHGVTPDLVASMDDTVRTWRYFVSNLGRLSDIPLLAPMRANHVLVDNYPGPIAFIRDERPPGLASELAARLEKLSTGRCVGHMAFHAAESLRPKRIVMTGFDLGYRGERFHPKDMPNPYYHDNPPPNVVEIPSTDGGRIKSELSMSFYIRYFEEAVSKCSCEVINATRMGGALIKGTRVAPLDAALSVKTAVKQLPRRPLGVLPAEAVKAHERLVSRLDASRSRIIERKESPTGIPPTCDDYQLSWLSDDDGVHLALAESGVYLQLARYRELCRRTPTSKISSLWEPYRSILGELLESVELLLETARARGVPHHRGARMALTPEKTGPAPQGSGAPPGMTFGAEAEALLPASTPLPSILKAIRRSGTGTLLAKNGGVIPDAWSIPGIWCVDLKTSQVTGEYERSLWIPRYSVSCMDPKTREQWLKTLPTDIILE